MANITINGCVIKSDDNSSITGANVLIKTKEGNLLAYGVSDINGKFTITIKSEVSNPYIYVTMIGFKPLSQPITFNDEPLIIKMEEGAFTVTRSHCESRPYT